MLYVKVNHHFDSAHHLPGYPGKCAMMHGHTWKVEITYSTLGSLELDELGMLIDFVTIKAVINELDHRTLNDVEGLEMPTAENIARWIWDHLPLATTTCLVTVTVQEGLGGEASYQGVKVRWPEGEEPE